MQQQQVDADTEWGRAIEQQQQQRRPIDDSYSCDADDDDIQISKDVVDIAIIGGGLAGLAVAIGLQRRNGLQNVVVAVYERAPQLRSQSQGILMISNNGMTALEKLHHDIHARMLRGGGCEHEYTLATYIDENEDGQIVETEKLFEKGQATLDQFGRKPVGMTWHNMQQVLASLVLQQDEETSSDDEKKESAIRIVTGHSLSHFQEFDDYVLLHFENGAVVRSKIALGCDGVFSAVRRQIHNDAPIWFGQLNWGTIIRTSELPEHLHPPANTVHAFQWQGNNKHARYMCMINDGGGGWTFFQFRLADAERSKQLSGNGGRGGLGLKGIKPGLIEAAQPCPMVAQVLERLPEEHIFERSIVARTPLTTTTTWRSPKGRVALVGDAAHGMHPNIGQGANTAFEGAAAVVQALADSSDNNMVQALEEYERQHRPRAALIQQFANAMGVQQATGQELVSAEGQNAMLEWIKQGASSSESPPPAEVVELLQGFDPLAQPGVSRLW